MPTGAGRPLPPPPSTQAPQPTRTAWLLTMVEAANSARLGVAIKQPPQVIRLGSRVGVVVGHSRTCCRRGRRRPPAWRLGASGWRRMPGIRGRPIGARDGAGCPTVVLPLGSQHRQYRRNPLEVLRRDHHVVMAWQNPALDDRRVEDARCPTAARRRATTERANAQAATRGGTGTGSSRSVGSSLAAVRPDAWFHQQCRTKRQ